MTTNTGYNLLEPGDSPHSSAQFLLFLTAVIKAVDDYQDMLRVSVASAGNDHRLGANEAPPAIISMFLGDELTEILEALETGASYAGREHSDLTVGVHVLPKFPKDNTDRTVPLPLPSRATSLSSAPWVPPLPFPRRTPSSTPSWPSPCASSLTSWRAPRTSRLRSMT